MGTTVTVVLMALYLSTGCAAFDKSKKPRKNPVIKPAPELLQPTMQL